MKFYRRQFCQLLLASGISTAISTPSLARIPLGKRSSVSGQGVMYPLLGRIGLVPPPKLVPANPRLALSMFIGGTYGFSDFIKLVFIADEKFNEINKGKESIAGVGSARPKTAQQTRNGREVLFERYKQPFGYEMLYAVSRVGEYAVEASVQKSPQGTTKSMEELLAALFTLHVRPPLTADQFNAESMIKIADFAGFVYKASDEVTLFFEDPTWNTSKILYSQFDAPRELSLLYTTSVAKERIKPDTYKIDKTGIDGVYGGFIEGTMSVSNSSIVEQSGTQWFSFEATGRTTDEVDKYVVKYIRVKPGQNIVHMSGLVPVAEKPQYENRFRTFRDSIQVIE